MSARPAAAALPLLVLLAFPPGSRGGEVEDAVAGLARYEFGADRAPVERVKDLVRETSGDPERRAALAAGLAGLLDRDATEDAGRFACRVLAGIGGEAQIPRLARKLGDPVLGEPARYALERIPGAAAALVRALPDLEGTALVGAINSLGALRGEEAVEALVPLLEGGEETAVAAASALADIGGQRALEALDIAALKLPPEHGGPFNRALLRCAQPLAARGRPLALAAVERLSAPPYPGRIRASARLAHARIDPSLGAALVREGLASEDPELRDAALRALRELPAERAGGTVEAVGGLPPDRLRRALAALAGREDALGLDAARDAAGHDDPGVRAAAWAALAAVGGPRDVSRLAEAAAGAEGDEREAARRGLARIDGDAADEALSRLAAGAADAVRIEAIKALAGRGASSAAPLLIRLAGDDDAAVRREAVDALGAVGGGRAGKELIRIVRSTGEEDLRRRAAEAFRKICNEGRTGGCREKIAAAHADASPGARIALLALFPNFASPELLEAARRDVSHADEGVSRAAVKALAGWPDPSPEADLLAVARSDRGLKTRVLAINGYVRMLEMDSGRTGAETVARIEEAFALSPRPNERKAVISAAAKVTVPESVRFLRGAMDDPELKTEAALALVKVLPRAPGVPRREALVLAKRAAREVPDKEREAAREAIGRIRRIGDYVTAWRIAGPFRAGDVADEDLLDHVFAPERGEAKAADWKPYRIPEGSEAPWRVEGDETHCVHYLEAAVYSPSRRKARLEIGSDDGVKVWLNGDLVHGNNARRAVVDGEDRADIVLEEGWNAVLAKVSQGGGPWGLSVRIRSRLWGWRLKDLACLPAVPADARKP